MTIPGTVPLTGTLAPTATTDTFATHIANYGRGGVHHVATTIERDAISTERRIAGLLVTITGDANIYRLDVDLLTWLVVGDGSTGSSIPTHGTTAQRLALSVPFTLTQAGYAFFDTDLSNLFFWNGTQWETSVIMGYGPRIAEYVGGPVAVLPLPYRKADRWTNTDSPACTVYVCIASPITNTLADWLPIGRQN